MALRHLGKIEPTIGSAQVHVFLCWSIAYWSTVIPVIVILSVAKDLHFGQDNLHHFRMGMRGKFRYGFLNILQVP
jgi:hypothetical protein